MRGREAREAPQRLLPLALRRDRLSALALVGGDDDVDEPLEEVALRLRAGPPRVLERLVCLEERAGSRQGEPPFV